MTAQILYFYDKLRFYLCSGEAHPHPAIPGKYLVSENAVGFSLPGDPALLAPWTRYRLSGDLSHWDTAPDNRGRTGYLKNGSWVQVETPELPPDWHGDEAPPAPPPTPEELKAAFTEAIQAHLDAFAQGRNYDNIFTACTYATSTNPKFAAEGQYCVEARDATWSKAYEILDEVIAGTRPMPGIEDKPAILAELPKLKWPE